MTASRLPVHESQVAQEWIDYNGHMSEAYYVLVFGHATDQTMDRLGMGPEHRAAQGCSLFTVEAHIRYLREVGLDTSLTVRTRVVGQGPKKLHLAHEMHADGELIATEEVMGLYVDQQAGGTVPFPDAIAEAIRAHLEPAPSWCGRRIG
ncbi:thioesterase family protein [Nesterenkonia xinjiangensis]|uniref:Acyl-CoA thioester hydrolase n=1 Tax=Nesterenkonia xinjiangensis TaxID=225327 RepID=A0A7Z0K9B7_9MICC|nr:thioesterase family protein [Nesterenkonia xinjiangensis]NYJ78531.1 acyl-CoA thioester hydrolase [Nesterenkonia xinjiangensis]